MANAPKKVGSAFVEIFVKQDALKKGLNSAKNFFEVSIRKMATTAKRGAIALGLAVGGASVYFTKLAMDAVETKNLFEVTFGAMKDAAMDWVNTTSKAYRANKYDLMGYYSTFQQLITGFGVGGDAANKMSQNMTKLIYDLTSFKNVEGGAQGAFQKIMSGLAGQSEPLMPLGIDLRDESVESFARENGLIGENVKQMDALTKTYARYAKVMADVERLGVLSDKINTADSPANVIRDSLALIKQEGTTIAMSILPSVGSALIYVRTALESNRDAIVEVVTKAITGFNEWFEKMGGLGGIIKSLTDKFTQLWPWIKAIGVAMAAAFSIIQVTKVVSAMMTMYTIVRQIGTLITVSLGAGMASFLALTAAAVVNFARMSAEAGKAALKMGEVTGKGVDKGLQDELKNKPWYKGGFLDRLGASRRLNDIAPEMNDINSRFNDLKNKKDAEKAAKDAARGGEIVNGVSSLGSPAYQFKNPLEFLDGQLGGMGGDKAKGNGGGGLTGVADVWRSIASAGMSPAEKEQIGLQKQIADSTARMAAAMSRGGGGLGVTV